MRARKAVGTYSLTDLLRNPFRWTSLPPGPESGQADIAAVRAGGVRIVSCFLRGSADPYPRRSKQGRLYISAAETYWSPFWSLRRPKLPIHLKARRVRTRPADHREPRVKKGGTGLLGVKIPTFMVVTCMTDPGEGDRTADFAVPCADAPLVASYLSGSLGP